MDRTPTARRNTLLQKGLRNLIACVTDILSAGQNGDKMGTPDELSSVRTLVNVAAGGEQASAGGVVI
jgi:hypothetical protein